MATPRDPDDLREQSIGDLLKQLSQETGTLVRQEMALARAEMTAKGKRAGVGAGMLGGAGVAGLLVPTTRIEDEKLAPMASDMREKAMDAGQEAMDRGKQVAQDAMQTAKESGQEHAQEMREQVSSR